MLVPVFSAPLRLCVKKKPLLLSGSLDTDRLKRFNRASGDAMTRRLTTAQAVIEFLRNQYIARDGREHKFFGGCFGIFGHGNVAGLGQALHQTNLNNANAFPYRLCRNEQAMVHTAAAYAKVSNRLGALVCTTSIGPGATNMITGAAAATVNRLPVLLLPGDIFARRLVAPVLQQLESPASQDISVNDCFKPVSRYWDRINRPEQIITALPEAMRVLTSPAETGSVTLAMRHCSPWSIQRRWAAGRPLNAPWRAVTVMGLA